MVKDLSIVVVNYNTRDKLYNCLGSMPTDPKLELEIIVVDNSSEDGSVEMVKAKFPHVLLLANDQNFGFAKANNQAILRSTGRCILLLNPDTVLGNNTLTELMDFMDTHSDAGATGCKLINGDGSLQFSIRNFPTVLNQLSECFFLHLAFPGINSLSEVVYDRRRYDQAQLVDWVSGAAMIIRRKAVAQIGLFDEDVFLYSEEVDWCYRLKLAGWQTYYFPKARLTHYHGESNSNPRLFGQMMRSKIWFVRKNYGPVKAGIYKALLTLNVLLRLAVWTIYSLVRRRDLEPRRKPTFYWGGLTIILARSRTGLLVDSVQERHR